MNVVWQLKKASVKEVTEQLNQDDKVAYNTVQTMMGILVDKGYLAHHKAGRAFIYEPLVDRNTASRSAVKRLVQTFFQGSTSDLVQNLLDDEEVDPMEIERLRRLIDESPEGGS